MEDPPMMGNAGLPKIVFVVAVVFVVCGLLVSLAEAQAKPKGAVGSDKEIATRKGISGSLGSKEWDKNKLPGKMEIGLAVGSVVVMIAVLKWL